MKSTIQAKILIGMILLLATLPSMAADVPTAPTASTVVPTLKVDEIVQRLETANRQRAAALRAYESRRSYQLRYQGFPSNREATLDVLAHYKAPESKSFDVLSESGSKMLQQRVLNKLLEGEREAAKPEMQRHNALSSENYIFTLLGTRPSPYGGCYRLQVEPRRDEKFLYRGEICVNAADFAVESIDAEPARNPSFWIKKTRIEHRYRKVEQFWLPASNQTTTNVRLGGTATLRIDYASYELR